MTKNMMRIAAAISWLALGGVAAHADTPASPSLAVYLQPVSGAAKAPDADGFLQRWLLLEPIVKPNRSNSGFTNSYVRTALTTQYFPGQFTALPKGGDTVKAPTPLRWHAFDAVPFDVKLFNFAAAMGKPTYGVIFQAVTVVHSPREMKNVRLAVGSNAASMWWLNGKEAVMLSGDRRMVMDDVLSPRLTLAKGRTVLRGAIINGPGLSDFCVRFVDEDGKPIRDITVDVK